jgi:hypothetical protein
MLQRQLDPRTPKQAALFAQETLEKLMSMEFSDDIAGVILQPPQNPKRYLNITLRMPGMNLVATFDMKSPNWQKAPPAASKK